MACLLRHHWLLEDRCFSGVSQLSASPWARVPTPKAPILIDDNGHRLIVDLGTESVSIVLLPINDEAR
jgi:hypothetical protein